MGGAFHIGQSSYVDYEKWRDQQLQDPEFVAELEKLEPGYQVARLRIKLGLTQYNWLRWWEPNSHPLPV